MVGPDSPVLFLSSRTGHSPWGTALWAMAHGPWPWPMGHAPHVAMAHGHCPWAMCHGPGAMGHCPWRMAMGHGPGGPGPMGHGWPTLRSLPTGNSFHAVAWQTQISSLWELWVFVRPPLGQAVFPVRFEFS